MKFTEKQLREIKNFGVLQYDIEKVLLLIQPENPDQFRNELKDINTEIGKAYAEGFLSGKYSLDAQQFEVSKAVSRKIKAEADKLEMENEKEKKYLDLKKELLNL